MNEQTVEVYSTYFCVLLRFASSSVCSANWYPKRVFLGAFVLAPRIILSAKGNRLEVHHSLFQSVLGLFTSNNTFQLLGLYSELWGAFVYHPLKRVWEKVAVACFVVRGVGEGSGTTPHLG